MYFNVQKPKTRKGLSYVLKSSVIQNALRERGISTAVYVDFFTPQHFDPANTSVFEAEYIPVSISGTQNRFHVRIGVVSSGQRKLVEQLFLDNVLSSFLNFVEYQLAKTKNSTHRGRGFYVKWVNGELVF